MKYRSSITEPQAWIDGLVKKYSPESEDIDLAIQNMGLEIERLNRCEKDRFEYYDHMLEHFGDELPEGSPIVKGMREIRDKKHPEEMAVFGFFYCVMLALKEENQRLRNGLKKALLKELENNG